MSVSGRIAIDVEFTDRTSTAAGSSLNTITLRDATEYATGKVAIVTGTCGTGASSVTINPYAPQYRNARDVLETFTSLRRLVFRATPAARINQGFVRVATSDRGGVCVNDIADTVPPAPDALTILTTAGTASFTLVLYGT
jgi:hypothetical protein